MLHPKVIDADGHVYENHERLKSILRVNIAVCGGRARTRFSLLSMAGRAVWAPDGQIK